MRLRILGSVQIWDGAVWSPVRARQQRVLLALLLAEAGRVVTTDRLVDEIWADRPPRTAVGAVHNNVMKLRRVLGARLVTRGNGYELRLDDDDLDATRFARLVAAGRGELAAGRVDAAVARLSEALALWRGPAMVDVAATPTVTAYVAGLEQSRLGALEERMHAELELGRHAGVVDELHRLADEHPLRERLWTLLMLAAYRCGRRAQALDAYRRARDVLVAELGVEPSTELRDLHRAIIAGEAPQAGPARGRPMQLPAEIAAFTGRDGYLDRLDALLPAGGAPRRSVVISAIVGTSGVGKSALAVYWAHRVRDRFPDGQLYVNLRGYAAGPPLRPIEVLARFLLVLGVPTEGIPVELDAATSLYRSLLADKRVLVVLDNAHHPNQIRPLLPGSADCLVLITSRDRLDGLVAVDGAVRVLLDVLDPVEAETLLTRLLGVERAGAEPDAVATLACLCDHLPLALRIAAANLTARPKITIASYTAELAGGNPLAALEVGGDPHVAVRAAFDRSYRTLPAPARRLFRLLGLVPGPDITIPAAAALASLSPPRTARLLDRLAAAHLVNESGPGRYSCHDLLRRYAAERAAAEDGDATRRIAFVRLYDHYLRGADAAAGQLYPQFLRAPLPGPAVTGVIETFGDNTSALAWLDAERPNLVAAVLRAAECGTRPAAWLLACALRGYLSMCWHLVDFATVSHAALAAAAADGDPRARAAAHLGMATLCFAGGEIEASLDHYTGARDNAKEVGWVECESAALGGLGNVYQDLGRPEEAAEWYTQALAIERRTGQSAWLSNLGLVDLRLGRLHSAARRLTEAAELDRRAGSRASEARTLAGLGEVYHALGRTDDALGALAPALVVAREVADRSNEIDILDSLAAVHLHTGRHAEALDLAGEAVSLARDTRNRRGEAVSLTVLASVHARLGDHRSAQDTLLRARELARTIGDRYTETRVLIGLATCHRGAGRHVEATALAATALATARERGYLLLERAILAAINAQDP
ncbi:MAG TPA: BTAD domain-containing putative transcriptional regulator [Actinophytocola sp.]|nr:BTAD domain-containing putative transcriptional regulator [Actinophytocola sp.]